MEFRQLEYFLATARLNNMTEAARQMHVSQPSLSNAVKSLETELGVPLFNRHGKRIELNEAGRYFASRVSSAMDVVTEAKDVVSQKDREREHTVNCTLGIPMGNQGKLISSFFKAHPDITVRVGYPSSKLFENQTIDLHLFGTSVDLDDTNVIKLGYERYVLILPKNHPLADRGRNQSIRNGARASDHDRTVRNLQRDEEHVPVSRLRAENRIRDTGLLRGNQYGGSGFGLFHRGGIHVALRHE